MQTQIENLKKSMRRIVTINDENGRSKIALDGEPESVFSPTGGQGLYNIWSDKSSGPPDRDEFVDRGKEVLKLLPPDGGFTAKWFILEPPVDGLPADQVRAMNKAMFGEVGAADAYVVSERDPGMHITPTTDIIVVVNGRLRLILDEDEAVLEAGSVVIQQGTSHAWVCAENEPAMFVAILVDRRE
ncbi:MAG: cupin domain-containing protein [Pseudomonadota bacterium]